MRAQSASLNDGTSRGLLRRLPNGVVKAGHWWAAVALAVGMVVALAALIPSRPAENDGLSYLSMANEPLKGSRRATWHSYRILAPLVVHLIPMPHEQGFRVLSLVALTLTALVLYAATLRIVGVPRIALLSVPLFLTSWAGIGNVWDPFSVDPMAWFFVALGWLGLVTRNVMLAAVGTTLGAATKEILALMGVAGAFVFSRDPRPRRSFWRAVVLLVPPVVVLLAIRAMVQDEAPNTGHYLRQWLRVAQELGPTRYVFYVFASYGAVWLLALRGLLSARGIWRRAAVSVLVLGAPLALIGTPERMLEFVFPAVVSGAVVALASLPLAASLALIVGNCIFILRVATGIIPSTVGWLGLSLAVALSLWAWRRSA